MKKKFKDQGYNNEIKGIVTSTTAERDEAREKTPSYCHVEGSRNVIKTNQYGDASSTSSHRYSHIEGYQNIIEGGHGSHVGGAQNISASRWQTVIGAGNLPDTNNEFAFIIGNGSAPDPVTGELTNQEEISDTSPAASGSDTIEYIVQNKRSNAFTVSWDGTVNIATALYVNGQQITPGGGGGGGGMDDVAIADNITNSEVDDMINEIWA